MRHWFLSSFLCCLFVARGQHITVVFSSTVSEEHLYMDERIGEHLFTVDSTTSDDGHNFRFDVAGRPLGYYSLRFKDGKRVEFIVTPGEDMNINVSGAELYYAALKSTSRQNSMLWNYKVVEQQRNNQIAAIKQTQIKNKKNRPLVNKLKLKIDSLVNLNRIFAKELAAEIPESYFAKTILAAIPSTPSPANAYFSDLDFTDKTLIRSNVFPERIMEYIHLHTGYKEPGFRTLVNTVMKKSDDTPEVREFLIQHLLQMFDEKGPPIMFQHMVETYLLADGCSEIDVSELIKNKAEAYRQLQVGGTAPDLALKTRDGKEVSIGDEAAKAEYTLLFFWYSSCSYCHSQIPALLRVYEAYKDKGYQVVAISIDTQKQAWENGIKQKGLPWLHLSDLKGWKSSAIQTYKVHKTPGYYLLDKEMNIIAKPTHSNQLKNKLQQLF